MNSCKVNPCEDMECQECCEHEFDPSEGFMCINCGKEGFEAVVAAAEFYGGGER